ncbi:hypothetical protein [Erythrobacter sp.]|nr:hypothetical protein [Erythrobacter sp.]MBO6526917.1 hypothetical protein [Erythrobacter sp.]MBO6528589.1 hypothetical protein [Erythrobacter sp.]
MIVSLILSLASPAMLDVPNEPCALSAPVRDPGVCEPIFEVDGVAIYNIESVAVGTIERMFQFRQDIAHCGLASRIDGVDNRIAVYDIVNADEQSRACVLTWIETNEPE